MIFQATHPLKTQSIHMLGLEVMVVRDDLNHPVVQGNKLRKLKYNFQQAEKQGCKTVLTFGGAYSNHLLATAWAANDCGFKSVGIVRGDELKDNHAIWSETLNQCRRYGMALYFVTRSEYRLKEDAQTYQQIAATLDKPFVIPEGGSNSLALTGVAELIDELTRRRFNPSHLFCPVGTGGTLAGLIQGVANNQWHCQVYGTAVLKGLHDAKNQINQWLNNTSQAVDWQVLHDFHCGGYAKNTAELERFCIGFNQQHGIALDKIYNSKSFYALAQLITDGTIKSSDNPMIIHTGGLQGGVF
ncbi:1-aminocyclopropane-1-carboxylate deaminase/D-cysteine desulfhydrase [Marinicella litoralis]|uniref:1-aminocyclopropane-1-carboxylate deaminase/D-cysteine desulfhydrase-like pyridoxal-dependent ACC family enzyme n=1 Tax=Marinicella litoralis TaxID=644220 RepID=A0A4R6XZK2_9GAMM|nr:pyridoxal-phosphate dependent enzyme [Marinicella litoralis]TDR23737.1 1-aminocyclopropane-1-carboxylate deaminase/D-cysteine desulfhydrase-like pyridoxal-dependent ACC family enzyme [Marinicella litoralis]